MAGWNSPPPSRALQLVEAVWKVQSLNFAYSGYATVYSCDALLKKPFVGADLVSVLDGLLA